jgi:outer membrane protein OmpA-like peptidoglycan-associated protein
MIKMQVDTVRLTSTQKRLMEVLVSGFGRPWVSGLHVCMAYIGVKPLGPSHLESINLVIADARVLLTKNMVEARKLEGRTFDWELRLSKEGKRRLQGSMWWAKLPLMVVTVAATACGSMGTVVKQEVLTPTLPLKPNGVHNNTGVLMQTRLAHGDTRWSYCYEDCPVPSKKILVGAAASVATQISGTVNLAPGLKPEAAAKGEPRVGVERLVLKPSTELASLKYAVFFKYASTSLNATGKAALEALAPDAIRAESIDVVGRADPSGDAGKNALLARGRAETVRLQLAQAGVDPKKISMASKVEHLALLDNTKLIGVVPQNVEEKSRRSDVGLSVRVLKGQRLLAESGSRNFEVVVATR